MRASEQPTTAKPFNDQLIPTLLTSQPPLHPHPPTQPRKTTTPAIRSFFLLGIHAEVFEAAAATDPHVEAAYRRAISTDNLADCWDAIAEGLSGCGSVDETHACTNPMGTAENIAVPAFVLNALDGAW